jgi:ankyrin repeat protein
MLRVRPDLPQRVGVAGKTRELTELLFRHGMNASHADWLGITPLHEFARKGQLDNARLFIEHGADVHARDEDICSTPLGWAAKFGQTATAELLLERGAKPNLPEDPPWATPLAWAVRRGNSDTAELLKRHGAI